MAIERKRRDALDNAPRFYPTEDGYTREALAAHLMYLYKKSERAKGHKVPDKPSSDIAEGLMKKLAVPVEEILKFANLKISGLYARFGSEKTFIKYFGNQDYSDRDPNTLYIQFALVSPRDPTRLIEVKEINLKTKAIEDRKIHPLYDEIEALEEMYLAFYESVKTKKERKSRVVV